MITDLEEKSGAKKFNDEEIFEIRFDVVDDAATGLIPLKFGNCVLADENGELLRSKRQNSNFEVKE